MKSSKSKFLSGKPIERRPIPGGIPVDELVDRYFQAYNAGRIREACQLYVEKMLHPV